MIVTENEKINIERSILKLKENFTKHNHSSSWSRNIQDASKDLKTQSEWVHFFHYLSDPRSYDFDKVIVPDKIEQEEADLTQDDRFETVVYKNGNECVIHLKLKDSQDQEDEKSER